MLRLRGWGGAPLTCVSPLLRRDAAGSVCANRGGCLIRLCRDVSVFGEQETTAASIPRSTSQPAGALSASAAVPQAVTASSVPSTPAGTHVTNGAVSAAASATASTLSNGTTQDHDTASATAAAASAASTPAASAAAVAGAGTPAASGSGSAAAASASQLYQDPVLVSRPAELARNLTLLGLRCVHRRGMCTAG